jgi:hypothetical protein
MIVCVVSVAQRLRRQVVALEIEGSNPSVHPSFLIGRIIYRAPRNGSDLPPSLSAPFIYPRLCFCNIPETFAVYNSFFTGIL